jgi:hypothetical protein
MMIIEKVYKSHQSLWDSCYGKIFGEANASKFNSVRGMVEWNRTLYPENRTFFNERARVFADLRMDSLLKKHLEKFNRMVPGNVTAEISILFTPIQGIGFGGCSNQQFCLELNNVDYDIPYTINYGIPHELSHMAYDSNRQKDSLRLSALAQMIDEGLACYFLWVFTNRKLPKYSIVEQMHQKDWVWYMKNEKQIFNKMRPYFRDTSGDNPLLQNKKYRLFADAPKTLFYWLGFRIVERYVRKHGKDSWKEIYSLPIAEVLKKSEYAEYIAGLP